MQLSHAVVVGKREYLTRVKSKGFWLATALLPLFMGAMVLGPALAASKSRAEQRLAIVDSTGAGLGRELAEALTRNAKEYERGQSGVRFEPQLIAPGPDPAAQRQELDRKVRAKEFNAWVWLTTAGLKENRFEYHSESLSNVITQERLKSRIKDVVSNWRLRQAGLDSAKIAELIRPFDLETVRVSATGSRAEEGMSGFMLAFGLCFVLYMVIIIYGSQVMQGVLEEKTSRVIEVITSAMRPSALMTGKLVGICLVALTQLAIWVAALVVLSSPAIIGAFVAMPAGMTLPSLSPAVVVHLFLLFLLGFFLYSTLYAMIGASFNSIQEAQQFAAVAVVFIVPPLMFIMPIINDPDSTLAVSMSFFPFFTPLVMMLRIASKMPPAWQIAAAYSICLVTIGLMIWLCARVYRVGILMYGKKPTLQEIWRWVRYA
ncbi:MAG TPA: ABC transporter permease [Thermoanaerobaculia bacterium]|nr:ABC transporter permease [Thermoanaerobaculia bacterium]